MDFKQIRLRRLEVQVHYDTAFLWFDTRGAIGRRWASSGEFGNWRMEGEQMLLVGDQPENRNLGIFGVRQCTFVCESKSSVVDARDLALKWLKDCETALDGMSTRRVYVRVISYFRIKSEYDRERMQASLLKQYPSLQGVAPESAGAINSGWTYNGLVTGTGWERKTSGIFGIMTPAHIPLFFLGPRPDDGEAGGLAMVSDVDQLWEEPASETMPEVTSLIDVALRMDRDSHDRVMIPVISRA